MSSVGNITFSESGKNIGGMMYFNTTDSQIKLASNATTITYTTDGTNALIPALYASGSIYTTGSFVMDNGKSFVCKDTGNVARSVIGVNSSNRLRIGHGHATGGNDHWTLIYGSLIAMYYGTSRTLGAILDGSGNVGIGTSSPVAKLDVNGQLKASAYLCCHNALGTYRTAGWVKVATIDITAASPSQPLKFRVTQRLRVGGELTVLFSHSSTAAETSLSEFFYTGDIVGAILVGGGSSYSLYIKKVGGTDRIGISLVDIGSYMNGRMTVTWEDAQYTETGDPVGTVASCRYYFASNVYMEYNATNEGLHVVNAGLYTDTYVSALGANSSGGGGSTTLLPPLDAINNLGIPAQYNSVIMYTSSGWKYQTINGSGTVTRVAMNVPAGFTIGVGSAGSGTTSPDITQSGTFYLGFGTTTANRVLGTDSNGAVSWRELGAGDIPDLSSTYATDARMDTVEGYFDSNGYAKTAAKLSTVSKTLWGNTYWTSGGVPTSVGVSGTPASLSYVSSISMAGDITGAGDITMDNKAQPKLIIGQDNTYYIRKASSSTLGYGIAIRAGGDGEQFAVYSTKTYTNKQLHTTVGLLSDGYVTALSDIRYKDVVAKVSPMVEDIAKASIIRYTWKFHADKTIHIGCIAQEWKVILPETVIDGGDKLSMDYGKIGAIAGIANARRIVDHEERIKQLEKMMSER